MVCQCSSRRNVKKQPLLNCEFNSRLIWFLTIIKYYFHNFKINLLKKLRQQQKVSCAHIKTFGIKDERKFLCFSNHYCSHCECATKKGAHFPERNA